MGKMVTIPLQVYQASFVEMGTEKENANKCVTIEIEQKKRRNMFKHELKLLTLTR